MLPEYLCGSSIVCATAPSVRQDRLATQATRDPRDILESKEIQASTEGLDLVDARAGKAPKDRLAFQGALEIKETGES
ncbi:hypothetical protein AAVH_39999 [Aphelenchoides avenae]|nr:hypothetical protein AAVH_39999 [Aphelenchus avenae]